MTTLLEKNFMDEEVNEKSIDVQHVTSKQLFFFRLENFSLVVN